MSALPRHVHRLKFQAVRALRRKALALGGVDGETATLVANKIAGRNTLPAMIALFCENNFTAQWVPAEVHALRCAVTPRGNMEAAQ
ncbi:MAG: hypothetical protein ACPGOY_13920 [Rhodospirillaceae bacterium]